MPDCAVAVDLGGTQLRAAVVDGGGRVIASASTATDAKGGPARVVEQIAALVGQVRGATPQYAVAGLGICAAGPLDPTAGVVIAPPTLAGWHDVPLVAVLRERLGFEVRLENDANAAALGEWRFGAGRGTSSMVFATISTGIGGGVIADKKLLHGRRGLAAEIGHMTIAEGTQRCACGALGCWEALASGTALGQAAANLVALGAAPALARLAGAEPVNARHVAEAARQGDGPARALLAAEARWLGIGLVNLLHLYSPERLILGGGVAACLDLMRGCIEATIRARAMSAYRDVPVLAAELGDHAGLIGAASILLSDACRG
jgi:glucokinase